MKLLKELLSQYPQGAVNSVVCLERHPNTLWVVGKVYKVLLDAAGNQAISDGPAEYSNPLYAKFGLQELHTSKVPEETVCKVNPHMKDGKLPILVTGFNPNSVAIDECKPVLSYKEIENLIRIGIDIQDALATNAPDLDRALVDLWFLLKGAK